MLDGTGAVEKNKARCEEKALGLQKSSRQNSRKF